MKIMRKIIEIDEEKCTGCGLCVPACAEGAIEIVDGKAKVIKDLLCDGLGACIGDCPEDALHIVEREAEPFDEEAVHKHLAAQEAEEKASSPVAAQPASGCGCPSASIMNLKAPSPCQSANVPKDQVSGVSALSHWPVQIRLIPPTAPFLKGADLLVTADCVPVSYPDLHTTYLKGRKVMLGCPKFDDAQSYIEKFRDIFSAADVKSVTVLIMEVPCCSGMPAIVKKGLELSGADVPVEVVVISLDGQIKK
ncbi:4Fe-4S ferredoxin [Desulfoluna limicola]|uniref:4Fe-4S ferredoxin n=1 Tax=Desulfoluna limicola TaxID=2810562 RepID=A0ABM7PIY9_9BACT|nr:4Fe-4S binding protein [Desulfoluna limicola]BCS97269.1 4Fe-4S ferredoxin [Desulfoluna limicola]